MLTVGMFWTIFIVVNMILWGIFIRLVAKMKPNEVDGLFMIPVMLLMIFNVFMIVGGLVKEQLIDKQSVTYRIVEDPKAEYKMVILEDGSTRTLTEAKYVNNDIQVFEGTYENRFGYDTKKIIYEIKEETTDGN